MYNNVLFPKVNIVCGLMDPLLTPSNMPNLPEQGAPLSSGQAARQVVLTLLRNWTQNSKVLKSLSPFLGTSGWVETGNCRADLSFDFVGAT